jgi:cysteine-rich repeat protein
MWIDGGGRRGFTAGVPRLAAGGDVRRFSMLAYCIGFLAISVEGTARAAPLIAGCCDSITSEPSYLDLVWDVYGWPPGPDPWDHNLGVDASPSSTGLRRLERYLATENPDAVVVLAGTPDTFLGPNGGPGEPYDQAVTVGNIAGMVEATLEDGGEPILVAPPPVFAPCDGSEDPSCAEINGRLADLALALEALVVVEDVAFVNLYALFSAHPDVLSLYEPDGVHPNHDLGDAFIANALLPEFAVLFCGNGSLDPGEECDDGNDDPRDGCSATCDVVECLDRLDNDGDGLTDHPDDPGCVDDYDLSERSPLLACDDGVDNDGDGLTDFPNDPGCDDPLDNSETSPTSLPIDHLPMCKSKRGKQLTVLVPPSKPQRLLDKG